MALFPVKRKNSVQADNTVYCSKATLQKWPTCISWNTQGLNPFRWLVRGLVAGKAPDFLCVWAREPAEAGPSQGKPLGRACCMQGPAQAKCLQESARVCPTSPLCPGPALPLSFCTSCYLPPGHGNVLTEEQAMALWEKSETRCPVVRLRQLPQSQ